MQENLSLCFLTRYGSTCTAQLQRLARLFTFHVSQLYFPDCKYKEALYRFAGITIRVSNSSDPDQAQQNVGPDLGPNCLQ